jgi:hypothetical protein
MRKHYQPNVDNSSYEVNGLADAVNMVSHHHALDARAMVECYPVNSHNPHEGNNVF